MDKKNMVIAILSIAFLVSFIGLISVSVKVNKIMSERNEFVKKIMETEKLTEELNRNITDLNAMLGREKKERERLTKEAQDIKKRLDMRSSADTTQKEERIPRGTP